MMVTSLPSPCHISKQWRQFKISNITNSDNFSQCSVTVMGISVKQTSSTRCLSSWSVRNDGLYELSDERFIVWPTHTHTHTHTHPFNGPFSGTIQVSRYQKVKTNLDFTEAIDNEWQWHQLGHMQVCTSLQTDNHASIPPLSFLQAGCPSCHPTNSVKALKSDLKNEYWQCRNWWLSGLSHYHHIAYRHKRWKTAIKKPM